jgi:microcystin-dependent protein
MASTASTVLRLEKMATSENSGTWGPKTNTNLEILEAAAGCGETAIATTSGTVTLTNVDYTNDQAKKRVIRCTGTLVGNLTIVIPNAAKTYLLINATAGAFTVSLKTSAGTAKTVTQSTSAELYCDGSDNVTFITPMANPTTGAPASASGGAASSISVTPTGNLSSTDAQAAFAELQTDIDNRQPLSAELTAIDAVTPTKGTIYAGNGSAPAALAVGADYTSPLADASQSTGLRYAFVQPIGAVIDYAGSSAPAGWLLCYGQAVSRTTYAALFAAISTAYGVGDGSTTFNLPDCRGRAVAGKDDMGGSSANRLTNQSGGLNGDTLGATGGAETVTLAALNMPNMNLSVSSATVLSSSGNAGATGGSGLPLGAISTGITVSIDNTARGGAQTATNNVQPTIVFNKIIFAAA